MNDPLVESWIEKLGLQDVPITVRHPTTETNFHTLYTVNLSYNANGFLIEYSKELPIWSSLHKLGYIYIANIRGKLDHLKEIYSTNSQQDVLLMSAFFDPIIEHYFREIDKEYQKTRGLQVFTHSSNYYNEWYNDISNTGNIVDICYMYITDTLNYFFNMPERYKIKLGKLVMDRFNKTRLLILEKAKKQGLKFTNDDFILIHDLLNMFEITLDYNLLIWYIEQIKEILEPIRSEIIFN